jgi:hypothetical protein
MFYLKVSSELPFFFGSFQHMCLPASKPRKIKTYKNFNALHVHFSLTMGCVAMLRRVVEHSHLVTCL